ncbi:hypothetical protein KEJ15_09275 [Candidatus Bathyarchaeota archaeon]|nr:hypothetical protein [Candidatus Bathyarchaeota archaeon]
MQRLKLEGQNLLEPFFINSLFPPSKQAPSSSKPNTTGGEKTMIEITFGIPVFISILMAVFTSLLGYFRNTPPENFNAGKFIATLIIGLVIGFMTSALGWTYEVATEWLATSGLIIWIYWIAEIVARRLPNLQTSTKPTA